ncbi:hypothetical protein [Raineyella fluvialis]|uniref:Uncharacterized protein n=1 Tax=Raineyella fluvialis TaxID=2662261 RepID=A0A5Q2FAL0_9ACTN|nr:hypothetical protein [Raineyella fluvialis]QGF24010.1 hypothetical protein Rai3103_10325 [Raineyella fluvialis]
MATWLDGPEYAPLVPPSGYEPAATSVTPALSELADNAAQSSPDTPPSATPPAYRPPADAVPLTALAPPTAPFRDPRQPFALVSRPHHVGSAWSSVHASPAVIPEPETPAAPYQPYIPYVMAPPDAPHYPDLDERSRAARWLALPPVLYIAGALAGPYVTAAVLAGAVLLSAVPSVPAAAKGLSRTVAGLLGALLLLGILAGQTWSDFSWLSRLIGLVYSIVLAVWYIRQRAAIDAERRRRTWGEPPEMPR